METYNITFTTPVGQKNAQLNLDISGGKVAGALVEKRKNFPIKGSIDGTSITFDGELKAAMGKMAYTFEGKLEDGKIGGVMKTKKGDVTMFGTHA